MTRLGAPGPSLTDPETCGEDLADNLRMVSDLAKRHCVGCEDYHIMFVARRLTQRGSNIELARPEVVAAVKSIIAARLARDDGPAEIIIAGSADTGILAAAAHAVAAIGEDALRRTSFTVLDLCRTPLELCAIFATRHGLRLHTASVDLLLDEAVRFADLVIVHSLFRHLPRTSHAAMLRKFGGWLLPQGRILFENKLEDDDETLARQARRPELVDRLRDGVRDGRLQLGEATAEFEARLARRANQKVDPVADYGSVDELKAMFDDADMSVDSIQVVTREVPSYGPGVMRTRAVAMLGRANG